MSRWVGLSAGLVVVGVLVWLFGVDELAAALRRARPGLLLVYLLLAAVVLAGYCLRWRLVAASLGAPPAWKRLVGARLAGDAVGWLVPSGKLAGEPVRVALLARDGVRVPEASAGVAVDRVLELFGNMVCALAYVAVFSFATVSGSSRAAPWALAAGLLIGMTALGVPLLTLRAGRRPFAFLYTAPALLERGWLNGFRNGLRRTEDHLSRFFREHPGTFLRGFLLSLAVELVIIVEYHFLLRAFSVELTLPVLLMVLLGNGFARAVPTPGALGALEAGEVAVLTLVAGDPATGFVVGVVLRLHETLWTAIGFAALIAQGISPGRLGARVEAKEAAA